MLRKCNIGQDFSCIGGHHYVTINEIGRPDRQGQGQQAARHNSSALQRLSMREAMRITRVAGSDMRTQLLLVTAGIQEPSDGVLEILSGHTVLRIMPQPEFIKPCVWSLPYRPTIAATLSTTGITEDALLSLSSYIYDKVRVFDDIKSITPEKILKWVETWIQMAPSEKNRQIVIDNFDF
jgi:hypothetical protein